MIKMFVSSDAIPASVLTVLVRQAADGVEVLPERRHHERRSPFKGMLEHERRTPIGRNAYGAVQFADRQRGRARVSCSGQIVVVP